ncbi:MAG: TetR family transcriptional regulator [Acidimicrobiales bacterium]
MSAPGRRDELVEGALAYTLRRGVADLSLRPLAAALGTSDRMLVYHFGSKRALIDQVLDRASSHLAAIVLDEMAAGGTAAERLENLWDRLASPDAAPYLRLWFEVQGLALMGRAPYDESAPRLLRAWVELSASILTDMGLAAAEARRAATVEVAAIQGLLLDLLATGDRERADAAARDVIARIVEWGGT